MLDGTFQEGSSDRLFNTKNDGLLISLMAQVDDHCPDLIKPVVKVALNDEGEWLACALNQTNVQNNSNKYFMMQVVQNNQGTRFLVSRSGRVGAKGTQNIRCYLDAKQAEAEFMEVFQAKTGLTWTERQTALPKAGFYTYVALKHEDIEPIDAPITTQTNELEGPVVEFMNLIFDEFRYNEYLKQIKLDMNKVPLGAISQSQIDKARQILNKLSELTDTPDPDQCTVLTSQFYSLIPTNFGLHAPPLLGSKELIKIKSNQLDNLDDIDVYKRLISKNKSKGQLSLTQIAQLNYRNLNAQIKPVTEPAINLMINRYLHTNGAGHYNLSLVNLLDITRDGEPIRYRRWQQLHNRQLLWHGSRVINYPSIITRGLVLNPGKSVTTAGSMFGQGLYFANCSTKSAQYMRAKTGDLGVMLLCEVALGNTARLARARTKLTSAPDNCHSTHGIGLNTPDPEEHITLDDGVVVPIGKLIKNSAAVDLNYDEFIVYNQSQVRQRYLCVVRIN